LIASINQSINQSISESIHLYFRHEPMGHTTVDIKSVVSSQLMILYDLSS